MRARSQRRRRLVRVIAGAVAAGSCGWMTAPVMAQQAGKNVVTASEDAFGTTVGLETAGIYSEADTRGFSPVDAGNARIDGVYYDPVGGWALALLDSTTIRVGTAAKGFPFQAPTGIVDYQLKPMPQNWGGTAALQYGAYGGAIPQAHLRAPILPGKLAIAGGIAAGDIRSADGSGNRSLGSAIRVFAKLGEFDLTAYYGRLDFFEDHGHTLVVPTGADLPAMPADRTYLGPSWAVGKWRNVKVGTTLKGRLDDRISIRAGLFRSSETRTTNFSDIYYITGPGNAALHQVIADPRRVKQSTSGEAIVTMKLDKADWHHRLFAGYRQRVRETQTGGSDRLNYGAVTFGLPDPQQEPVYAFGPVSQGRLKQASVMLGYVGGVKGVAEVNLGVQRTRYSARFADAVTGRLDSTSARAWLYNATATVDLTGNLSAYVGTQRGLEDRGVAPDTAANRNEQLPATLATQYEGGLRWNFSGGRAVLNLFEISKPYFSYDLGNRYAELGIERHRGVEASLAGTYGRLTVLGGIVAMERKVSGAAVEAGMIGSLPTATPAVRGRFDFNYRTDILGGLTPIATVIYKSERAAGSRPQAALGGRQLMLPGFVALDLGVRQAVRIGTVNASVRALVENVFDCRTWTVAAADTLFRGEIRRFSVLVMADF